MRPLVYIYISDSTFDCSHSAATYLICQNCVDSSIKSAKLALLLFEKMEFKLVEFSLVWIINYVEIIPSRERIQNSPIHESLILYHRDYSRFQCSINCRLIVMEYPPFCRRWRRGGGRRNQRASYIMRGDMSDGLTDHSTNLGSVTSATQFHEPSCSLT